MRKHEIAELLKLLGWSRTKLAAELDLTENTVQRWFMGDHEVKGPASVLMRQWLEEARRQSKKQTVPA
jgi:DNA-binding transcriptional regulator YiaG